MADPDDAASEKMRTLEAELDALNEARDIAEADRYHLWRISVGPVRLARYVGSQRLGWLFIGFHAVVGSLGIACFFLPGVFPDLVAAIVVGALFGFGAFLAQIWTRQTEREEGRAEEDYRRALRELDLRRQRVELEMLAELRRLGRE